MNPRELLRYLENGKRVLLLEGGMGTLLAEKGWNPPVLPEEMNLGSPEIVESIHASYRSAGADILETNTFGGSPVKLAARGLGARAKEINARAAALARSAAGSGGLVAGSMGPLGELLAPFGKLTFEEARKAFRFQAEGLAEGGADFFLIETMLDLREAKAAVLAVKDAAPGMAFVVSFTFDRLGRTVTGTPPEVAARWACLAGLPEWEPTAEWARKPIFPWSGNSPPMVGCPCSSTPTPAFPETGTTFPRSASPPWDNNWPGPEPEWSEDAAEPRRSILPP